MKNTLFASVSLGLLGIGMALIGSASAQDRSDRDARTGLGIAGAVLGTPGYDRDRYDRDRYERRREYERRHYRDRDDD